MVTRLYRRRHIHAYGGTTARQCEEGKQTVLIRHNVRTGPNQTVHFAHDTDKPDINGCYVSGRQGKVYTTPSNPCPSRDTRGNVCGGYGALVPIIPLPRGEYPIGSVVPDRYRKGGIVNPSEPVVNEPTVSEPVTEPVAVPEPVATEPVSHTGNGDVIADVFRTVIETAIKDVTDKVRGESQALLDLAVESLSEKFDETVRRLIVPVTIKIERTGQEPITLDKMVHQSFPDVMECLQAGENVFLTGPAGCGKTTIAEDCARALEIQYRTTGQVMMASEVMGFPDANGHYHTTPFAHTFRNGGLWLGDEFDGWEQEASLALNGALANGVASFPDSPDPVFKHDDAFFMVAGNTSGEGATIKFTGRNPVDFALLDRFTVIHVDYDKALETQLAVGFEEWRDLVWKVRENSEMLKYDTFNGTRNLVRGIKYLRRNNWSMDKVANIVLRRNLTNEQWNKVTA